MAYIKNDIKDLILYIQKVHSISLGDVDSNPFQELIIACLKILNKGSGIPVIPSSNPYNALNGDIILADATNGIFFVKLPSDPNSRVAVKKIDVSINVVRIAGIIDGDVDFDIENKDEVIDIITTDGINWFII